MFPVVEEGAVLCFVPPAGAVVEEADAQLGTVHGVAPTFSREKTFLFPAFIKLLHSFTYSPSLLASLIPSQNLHNMVIMFNVNVNTWEVVIKYFRFCASKSALQTPSILFGDPLPLVLVPWFYQYSALSPKISTNSHKVFSKQHIFITCTFAGHWRKAPSA